MNRVFKIFNSEVVVWMTKYSLIRYFAWFGLFQIGSLFSMFQHQILHQIYFLAFFLCNLKSLNVVISNIKCNSTDIRLWWWRQNRGESTRLWSGSNQWSWNSRCKWRGTLSFHDFSYRLFKKSWVVFITFNFK